MIRIHTDSFVPKYVNGQWVWNEEKELLEFESRYEATRDAVKEEYIMTGGYKFMTSMNQLEEMIFRQEFSRPDTTYDPDVIQTEDLKNLVLFLSPSEFLTEDFLSFINSKSIHSFLKTLTMYFDYYLQLVEFVLIRRDEISGEKARIQSDESSDLKRNLSAQLTLYRLLLARAYSKIILGTGDLKRYYHIKPIVNISQSIKDKAFHEMFLAYCTQFVWITMHRRAYDFIDAEMNRLFRSEHFWLSKSSRKVRFSEIEARMLYGKNYKRSNYRTQISPLVQELISVDKENVPALWIGNRKYRGNDMRIHALELKYIIPVSQLSLCNISIGILGHPKALYNTLLKIDWEAVRFHNFSEDYDPYRIITQPSFELPPLHETEFRRKYCKAYESYYKLERIYEGWPIHRMKKWLRRDSIIQYFKTEGMITDIWMKCLREVNDRSYGPKVADIIRKFVARKQKMRKTK